MSIEGEIPEVLGEERLLAEYVRRRVAEAAWVAEGCGCQSCKSYYQSWLDWRDMKKESVAVLPPFPTPPSFSELPPGHPGFSPDEPPPDINSGHLSDWYGAGL